MVDVFGLRNGINPVKGFQELNYSDLTPQMNLSDDIKNANFRTPSKGVFIPLEKTTRELEQTCYRSTLKQVLPAKGLAEAVTYGRVERPKNDYIQVSQGFARHQHKGLAYDACKPLDDPIMPIAGSFNQDLVNVLGNLK